MASPRCKRKVREGEDAFTSTRDARATQIDPQTPLMNQNLLEKIVNAVLYEGYILYPYRASSKKNRQRFTFGRNYPEDYSIAQKAENLARCRQRSWCARHRRNAR